MSHSDSSWSGGISGLNPLMCATPAELTHTLCPSSAMTDACCQTCKKSVILLRLRHKSMPALLWIVWLRGSAETITQYNGLVTWAYKWGRRFLRKALFSL